MYVPPDEVERIERQRFRNRWINVAWLIFIFSPLLFIWFPRGIANFQATVQYLIDLFKLQAFVLLIAWHPGYAIHTLNDQCSSSVESARDGRI